MSIGRIQMMLLWAGKLVADATKCQTQSIHTQVGRLKSSVIRALKSAASSKSMQCQTGHNGTRQVIHSHSCPSWSTLLLKHCDLSCNYQRRAMSSMLKCCPRPGCHNADNPTRRFVPYAIFSTLGLPAVPVPSREQALQRLTRIHRRLQPDRLSTNLKAFCDAHGIHISVAIATQAWLGCTESQEHFAIHWALLGESDPDQLFPWNPDSNSDAAFLLPLSWQGRPTILEPFPSGKPSLAIYYTSLPLIHDKSSRLNL